MTRLSRSLSALGWALAPALAGAQGTPGGSPPDSAYARLVGTVRDSAGQPVAAAHVSVLGTTREALTSALGAFLLDSLPVGRITVVARTIGLRPGQATVELIPGGTASVDIAMGQRIAVLETRRITEQTLTMIERRVRMSVTGHFIKPERIAARGSNASLASLLNETPGVKVDCVGPNCRVLMRRFGISYCTPSLYVDGNRDFFASFTRLYSADILAIEVYREIGRPFEFSDSNRCGAVVVWTRLYEPRQRKPR